MSDDPSRVAPADSSLPQDSPYYEAYWSGHAPPEDDPLTAPRVQRFVQRIPPAAGLKVLDAGCGAGLATKLLRESGHDVQGIDISQKALDRAKVLCPSVRFTRASFDERLPFEDGFFRAIYCGDVVEHVYDTGAMAGELFRVLSPGGELFMSTPYHGLVKNVVLSIAAFDSHFDPEGAHVRFFSERTLRRLLERVGFRLDHFEHLGRFWPLWANMIAIAHKPAR